MDHKLAVQEGQVQELADQFDELDRLVLESKTKTLEGIAQLEVELKGYTDTSAVAGTIDKMHVRAPNHPDPSRLPSTDLPAQEMMEFVEDDFGSSSYPGGGGAMEKTTVALDQFSKASLNGTSHFQQVMTMIRRKLRRHFNTTASFARCLQLQSLWRIPTAAVKLTTASFARWFKLVDMDKSQLLEMEDFIVAIQTVNDFTDGACRILVGGAHKGAQGAQGARSHRLPHMLIHLHVLPPPFWFAEVHSNIDGICAEKMAKVKGALRGMENIGTEVRAEGGPAVSTLCPPASRQALAPTPSPALPLAPALALDVAHPPPPSAPPSPSTASSTTAAAPATSSASAWPPSNSTRHRHRSAIPMDNPYCSCKLTRVRHRHRNCRSVSCSSCSWPTTSTRTTASGRVSSRRTTSQRSSRRPTQKRWHVGRLDRADHLFGAAGHHGDRFGLGRVRPDRAGEPRLTAAIPVENPYCSCKRTRVRCRGGGRSSSSWQPTSTATITTAR